MQGRGGGLVDLQLYDRAHFPPVPTHHHHHRGLPRPRGGMGGARTHRTAWPRTRSRRHAVPECRRITRAHWRATRAARTVGQPRHHRRTRTLSARLSCHHLARCGRRTHTAKFRAPRRSHWRRHHHHRTPPRRRRRGESPRWIAGRALPCRVTGDGDCARLRVERATFSCALHLFCVAARAPTRRARTHRRTRLTRRGGRARAVRRCVAHWCGAARRMDWRYVDGRRRHARTAVAH